MADDELPDRLGRGEWTETPCPNCGHDPTVRIHLTESPTSQPVVILCLDCGDVREWPGGGAS